MPASLEPRAITLALQGGGSLGAFGWGVLDRLLDEPGLRIEVVSGTSAGAINAALLVQGLARGRAEGHPDGGRAAAKRLLELVWRRVAVAAGSPDLPGIDWLHALDGLLAPVRDALQLSRVAGFGALPTGQPLRHNPLRQVLDGLLDPALFGTKHAPILVVAATRVSTGEARLFRDAEVTAEVLLASACLPQIFPAVRIDGEAYWDGGYSANPPLRPLIEAGAPADVVIVRTTPVERPDVPADAAGVQARAAEIGFDAALRREITSVATAQRLLAGVRDLTGPAAHLRAARLHMIGADAAFRALPRNSGLDASWGFLREMRDLGARTTDAWLAAQGQHLGECSTLDFDAFAGPALAA